MVSKRGNSNLFPICSRKFLQCLSKYNGAPNWVRLLITFPPEDCIVPSIIMRANQQKGSFLVSTYLIAPCPVTDVYAVFRNRILPPRFSGQPKVMATACFGSPWTSSEKFLCSMYND